MPKTGFQTCRGIMTNLKRRGYVKEATVDEVGRSIKLIAGIDSRTCAKYLKALGELGFIKNKKDGICILHPPGGSK